jgi:hypothetical protein
MTITVADLVRLATADPAELNRLANLANRLRALDAERDEIITELARLGIAEDHRAATPVAEPAETEIPRLIPRRYNVCKTCGDEATVVVDGLWYCEEHDPTAI